MQSWRRVIATLLILVFAPASVLAAVPLQLCLGNDGHHAIESAFAPDHHLTSHHADHTHSTVLAFSDYSPESAADCVDVILQPIPQVSAPKSGFSTNGFAPNFDSFVGGYPQPTIAPVVCDSVGLRHHALGGVIEDPRLAILATVVLRN